MLLLAAALALALSQAAVAARLAPTAPTPTVAPGFAAVFPRQTAGPECSSVLDNLPDMPTPPPDLSSYMQQQQAVAASTDPCAIRYPNSLTSEASRYQSQLLSWVGQNNDLLTRCPALSAQYGKVCEPTERPFPAMSGFNNAVVAGSGAGDGGSGGSGSLIIINGNGDSSGGGGGGGGGGGSGGGGGGGDSSGGSSLSAGAIAGIVIGVLIGLGVLAAIIALLIWRSRRRPKATNQMDLMRQQQRSMPQMPPPNMMSMMQQQQQQQQPSQTFNKDIYHVHEMSQPGVKPPSELMGDTEAPPVELGYSSGPVYEMLAEHRPKKAAPNLGYKS